MDQKITELTEQASPNNDDYLVIVDTLGTPTSKKIKISSLLGIAIDNETPSGLINGSNKVYTFHILTKNNKPSPTN